MGIKGKNYLEERSVKKTIDSLRYLSITQEEEEILDFLRFFVSAYKFREKFILERRTLNFATLIPWKTTAEILENHEEILRHPIGEVSGHNYTLDDEKINDLLKKLTNKGLVEEGKREKVYRITINGVMKIKKETETES